MKNNGLIKFILMLLIILLVYLCIVLNINIFTLSYDEKTQVYDNPYYMSDNKTDVFSIPGLWGYDFNSEITLKDVEQIKHNDIIKNILKNCTDIGDNNIDDFIDILYNSERIHKLTLTQSYSDIIYIMNEEYSIAFTIDFKNIAFQNFRFYNRSSVGESKEISIDDQKEMFERSKTDLKNLGIDFNPNTIYTKYFNSIQSDYVIEDITNNIKVEYEMPLEIISSLQIGF